VAGAQVDRRPIYARQRVGQILRGLAWHIGSEGLRRLHTLMRWIERHKYLLLLVAMICMSILQATARFWVLGPVLFEVVVVLVLCGVLLTVFKYASERLVGVALVAGAVAMRGVGRWVDGVPLTIVILAHSGLLLGFFGFAVSVIVRRVFEERSIRVDHVIGTLCGYFLIGAAWAHCYIAAYQLAPYAFRLSAEVEQQMDSTDSRRAVFNNFSVCTLTGVGSNEVIPIGPAVSTLTWVEAALGQFYLAVIVAQLVSVKMARTAESEAKTGD